MEAAKGGGFGRGFKSELPTSFFGFGPRSKTHSWNGAPFRGAQPTDIVSKDLPGVLFLKNYASCERLRSAYDRWRRQIERARQRDPSNSRASYAHSCSAGAESSQAVGTAEPRPCNGGFSNVTHTRSSSKARGRHLACTAIIKAKRAFEGWSGVRFHREAKHGIKPGT